MEELIFKNFCRSRHISAEDYETYEDWEYFEKDIKSMIRTLLTKPIYEAAKEASEKDWIWKHYRHLVETIIYQVMV